MLLPFNRSIPLHTMLLAQSINLVAHLVGEPTTNSVEFDNRLSNQKIIRRNAINASLPGFGSSHPFLLETAFATARRHGRSLGQFPRHFEHSSFEPL